MPRIIDETRGTVVAQDVRLADGVWSRFWGLMGRRALPNDAGLLLKPTSSIHTAFMRFPIDIVFLDRSLQVVKVVPEMKPFRVSAALATLLAPWENAGAAPPGQTGDQLALEEQD
jgi:uncharacterized membrane protein (UPF0127 family)